VTDPSNQPAPDPTADGDTPRAAILAQLRAAYAIAVVRTPTLEQARAAAHALIAGGLTTIEITMTVPDAPQLIRELVKDYQEHQPLLIGAGTILTPADARAALDAGARFLVSPVAPPGLAELAHAAHVPMVLGGLTPTEIVTALGLGADMVKVFPVGVVGGPAYLQAILGPFPDLPLMASGGPRLADLAAYRRLGVQTLAFTTALLPPDRVERGDWDGITELAREAAAALRAQA
jgi:2-dehydro-3-deoxyphosphogluconate aldolase/(4S)-4-hydroxy-2-oxoglutarate aldolase